MTEASTFSTQERIEFDINPDSSPILFKGDIIKVFITNNMQKINSAINNARTKILNQINSDMDVSKPTGGKKKSRKMKRKLKKRTKRRLTCHFLNKSFCK